MGISSLALEIVAIAAAASILFRWCEFLEERLVPVRVRATRR